MKTLRICKSTVSMILALIMLVSMCTVAFVGTSAAETDVTQTGAGTTVYFQNNWKWTDVRIHVWDSSETALAGAWPGAAMTKIGTNGDYDYYKYTLPTNAYGFIFNGIKNDGSGARDQSPDIKTIPTNDHFYYMNYSNGNQCLQANESITVKFPSEGGSTTDPTQPTQPTEPDDPDNPVEEIEISFLINSDTKWVSSDDAKMFINDGSKNYEMTETVDTKSGHIMWTAEVPAKASYTFYRTSYFFDEDNAASKSWNSWTASNRGSNTVFKATSSTGGSWAAASTVNAADPKNINNFWDDLWIDTKGEGNPEHAIKVHYTGSTFHLYVPSYVDLSDVTVYTDHEKVVIDGTEYASGTKANLTTGTKTFQFKDGSTTTNKGNITIYQTQSTAAMLMTTKEELYTGTTAGLAINNAWPTGSGITADNYNGVYKDAIETKGSYYFYDEDGEWVNTPKEEDDGTFTDRTVLKKIKGRGNSSFEASMKIYGKYAYNFNLDEKIKLIDGSTASKKWCMLANNVDHSMMRNTFIYALADDIGIKYSPETRLVDVYDNGKYLGAYVITEKVEYGKNTMMKDMKNLDDGNEDANIAFYKNEDIMDDLEGHLVQAESSVTVNGQKYTYQYTKSDDETNWPYKQPCAELTEDEIEDYNYLLEFELHSRYTNEASWFVSPRTNQAVVVKYPEFATKDEMEWIISEFEKAESAIYADDTDAIKAAVDVDSFAKMYLLQELSMNLDSCATSYYIHNDLASGKLVSSPVWDYDWAFGAYAKDLKYIYNGSSVTTSANMSSPNTQMFVKNKALQTDAGNRADGKSWISNYNFQAKLVHNDYVWERCQYLWTNYFVDALNNYIINESVTNDTKGIIEDEWLPKFSSSVNMNNARWGALTYEGDDWGTKVTSDYNKRSYNFYVGNCYQSGTASAAYENTVYYLNDWIATRWNYMSSSTGGNLYNEALKDSYKVEDVSFVAEQSADKSTVAIKPSATVTLNDVELELEEIGYTVYLNDKEYDTFTFADETPVVSLENGIINTIYIVVFPIADESKAVKSESQVFNYGYVAPDVTFTVKFKSSNSYRYIPKVKVGDTEYEMTKEGKEIAKNASGTQKYYWYTADIAIADGDTPTLTFTNSVSMRASITLTDVKQGDSYYFAVDNINNGTSVVDLTNATDYQKNFVKSATNMVTNDPEEAGIATTSIDGTIYKMGDTDEDNKLTILDATTLQLALVEKTELSDVGQDLADFDLNGTTSITDATNIQINLVQG